MGTQSLFETGDFITLRVQKWIEDSQGLWNMVCKIWNEHADEGANKSIITKSFSESLNTSFILLWAKDGRYNIPAHVIHNEDIEEIEGVIVDEGGDTGDLIDWNQIAHRWIRYAFMNTKPERGWQV